jgi:hypothetical protein
MAEDVAAGPAVPPAAERPAPTRAERAHASAYYTRFSFAFMLLIVVAVLAVGGLVIVLIHPGGARAESWSKFKPTGSSLAVERQIATQVAAEYKASTAARLVSVFPGALEATRFVQGDSGPTSVQVPISLVAVQADTSKGQHEEGDFTFFDPHSTVSYEMCGIADTRQNCGVLTAAGVSPEGLLRREGLELALYTLKYVPDTNAVIVYFPPPGNPQLAPKAMLIARKDVQPNLRLPLRRTLKPQQVILGGGVPDGGHVGGLTASRVYTSDYQTLPGDGTSALVLTPAITAG